MPGKIILVAMNMLALGLLLCADPALAQITAKEKPVATETATFGGGCFWCLEAVFEELHGVKQVESGYAGGGTTEPSYKEVCSGGTGHAEVVQITFDPEQVSYRDLLEGFFASHDPTTLNRQGADVGTQYRSVILTASNDQEKAARDFIKQITAEEIYSAPIVTEVSSLQRFYPAEAHHQDYYRRNPDQDYCQVVINPKLQKFRQKFADRLRQ